MAQKILASILSADFACLGDDISKVIASGADGIHFDVMDNNFVPNLTIGPDVCRALRSYGIECHIDVHLMTNSVANLAEMFAKAGANAITFHVEVVPNASGIIDKIKGLGCKVGLALNPDTPPEMITKFLPEIDLVLVMSVNPGFGGQKFIPSSLDKIKYLADVRVAQGLSFEIAVDGGLNETNLSELANHSVDSFIIGSALFGAADYSERINLFRSKLCQNLDSN